MLVIWSNLSCGVSGMKCQRFYWRYGSYVVSYVVIRGNTACLSSDSVQEISMSKWPWDIESGSLSLVWYYMWSMWLKFWLRVGLRWDELGKLRGLGWGVRHMYLRKCVPFAVPPCPFQIEPRLTRHFRFRSVLVPGVTLFPASSAAILAFFSFLSRIKRIINWSSSSFFSLRHRGMKWMRPVTWKLDLLMSYKGRIC